MTQFDGLSEFFEEVKLELMRIASIVSKVDGAVSPETISQLKMLRLQLDQNLAVAQQIDHSVDYTAQQQPDQDRDATKAIHLSGSLIAMLSAEANQEQTEHAQAQTSPSESITEQPNEDAPAVEQPSLEDLTPEQREELLNEGFGRIGWLGGDHRNSPRSPDVDQRLQTAAVSGIAFDADQQCQPAHGFHWQPGNRKKRPSRESLGNCLVRSASSNAVT